MRARVDLGLCIGCELCSQICPEVFQMQGNMSRVYTDPVPEIFKDRCQEAAGQCSVNAIKIER